MPDPRAASSSPAPSVWSVEGLQLDRPRLTIGHLTGSRSGLTLVTGPNGAGKTTLLRVLAGILPAPAARIFAPADRAYVTAPPPWFHPDLKIEANLRFLTGARDRPVLAVADLLTAAGVEASGRTRFGTLSEGEQARVALAAELAHPPGLLLVDEALRSVDAHHRPELAAALVRLTTDGTQVVLVDHAAASLDLPSDTEVVHLAHGAVQPPG